MAEAKKKTEELEKKTSAKKATAKPEAKNTAKKVTKPQANAVVKKESKAPAAKQAIKKEAKVSTKAPVIKSAVTAKQKIRIRLKSYDHKIIDQSAKQIVDTALRTGASIAGPIPLPTRKTKFTVVKSPHVFKKGREQFEMRVHKRLIDVFDPTPKTIDSLMNLSLPAGCDAEIKM